MWGGGDRLWGTIVSLLLNYKKTSRRLQKALVLQLDDSRLFHTLAM